MEVIARAYTPSVFFYLDLFLCLFFCSRHDSYVAPIGVLRVLLLLGGCLTS